MEHDDYCDQMRRGADGEMPRNPVGVLELMGWSQKRDSSDTHNNGIELPDQSCMTASQKMAGLVERVMRDER